MLLRMRLKKSCATIVLGIDMGLQIAGHPQLVMVTASERFQPFTRKTSQSDSQTGNPAPSKAIFARAGIDRVWLTKWLRGSSAILSL